jgi:hypothetical protein
MPGIPLHVETMRPNPPLPDLHRCTVRRAQLPQERALQRPQRRQRPARRRQLTMNRRDIPMPAQIGAVELLIDQPLRLLHSSTGLVCEPAPNRPRRATQLRGRRAHDPFRDAAVSLASRPQTLEHSLTGERTNLPFRCGLRLRSKPPRPTYYPFAIPRGKVEIRNPCGRRLARSPGRPSAADPEQLRQVGPGSSPWAR